MAEFTPTQGRYLSYIHTYIQGFQAPPAQVEIAEALGVSSASVAQMLKTLEKKKLIRLSSTVPKGIEVLVDEEELPKWKGRRITRTVRQWVADSQASAPTRALKKPTQIYQLKITLDRSQPAIWRRIETEDLPLGSLHECIQTAMGWQNSHLHQFKIDGKRYTDPRFLHGQVDDFGAADYTGIRLSDLVSEHGPKLCITYEYDFGDGWVHTVALEKIAEPEPKQKYPRCTDGKRACPPENVGGVYGYQNFLEAIADPKHEEHEDYMDWIGPFDPEKFDPARATKAMRKGLPKW